MTIPRCTSALVIVLVMSLPAVAWAHGDAITTDPAADERVAKPPGAVVIDFTEPPTNDSVFTVVDGCGDDVLGEVERDGNKRTLRVNGGEPGKWKVTYQVISATDGHPTKDRFSFRVKGSKDCSEPEPGDAGTPDIGDAGARIEPEEGSNFPLVPVLGGVATVALAVVIRVLSSR